jgi:hypothetical protein
MVSTKAKDLIPEAAKELGLPEEHLKIMFSFYIKENKKVLSNLEYLNVRLNGLGVMTIKGWEIEKQIEQMKKYMLQCRIEESIQEYERNIKVFERVLPKWKEQEKNKKIAKKRKQEYYKNKEANNDLKRKDTNSLE